MPWELLHIYTSMIDIRAFFFIGLRRLPGGLLSVNTLPQLKCCFDFSPKTFYQSLILSKWSHRMFLLLSVENSKHGWSHPWNCHLNYYPIVPFKATTTNTYFFPLPLLSLLPFLLSLPPHSPVLMYGISPQFFLCSVSSFQEIPLLYKMLSLSKE